MNIEEDALLVIKQYAEEREISMGQAASDLVHRGAESLPRFKTKNGWAILDVPARSKPLTNEVLDNHEAMDYEEEYQRAISPGR